MSATPSVLAFCEHPDAAIETLREAHGDLAIHGCDAYEDLPAALAHSQAEVVYSIRFGSGAPFPRAPLLDSGTVKWISVGGSGVDHLNPWNTDQVTVTNSAGVAADMMAEYAIGAMLSFTLDLRGFAKRQAARQWTDATVEPIEGKTMLIVGLGKTGVATARRAKAMGMRVLGVRARPQPTPNVDEVLPVDQLTAALRQADVVLVCTPLTPSTQGLIDADAFAAMKPSAILIDVSRGKVIDETALLAALDGGRIRGAALDVFAVEPLPSDHRLWSFDNVIITPHCSSIYDGWETKSVRMFSDNLGRYRRGEPLENIVDPSRGY